METLNKEQKQAYIADDCRHCPFCNSDLISADDPIFMSNQIIVSVNSCKHCGKEWEEKFVLKDITDDGYNEEQE